MTYLITFNCYGKHLPGDAAGWIDRARGDHRGGFRAAAPALELDARRRMTHAPYLLKRLHADIVLSAMREVCGFREWRLFAAHVRMNHVHAVIEGEADPKRMMRDLKAYASRALHPFESKRTHWARGGSVRLLANDRAIEAAVRYVCDGQGDPMAVYIGEQRHIP